MANTSATVIAISIQIAKISEQVSNNATRLAEFTAGFNEAMKT